MIPHWIGDSDHRSIGKIPVGGCITFNDYVFFNDWRDAGAAPPNEDQINGNLLFYLFYEHDNWPAALKSKNVSYTEFGYGIDGSYGPITTTLTISYRSAQTALAWGVMNSFPVCDDIACGNTAHPCVHRIENPCWEAQFGTIQ
jgi:hypothetical protein